MAGPQLPPPSTMPLPGGNPVPPPEYLTTAPVNYPGATDQADALTPPVVTDPGPPSGGAPPQIVPEMSGATWYSDGEENGRYEADMGVLQMPVGGPPGTPAEIIRVHAPCETRVVEWTVERVGAKPRAPSAVTNNPSEVLVRRIVWPLSPTMGPDGKLVYRLSGRYEYLCILPHQETDALSAGIPMWSTLSPSQTNVEVGQWDPTLLNSADTVPAGFVPPTN